MILNELNEILKENGVVGAGGAGFPTYAKLSSLADVFIVNCAECEPLLKLHRQLLSEKTSEILFATNEIIKAIGAKTAIIAVKKNFEKTINALMSELDSYPAIKIFKLNSTYPAGDELLLIKEVTKRVIKAGQLPISEGVIVNNVETVFNVYNAMQKIPVTSKYVSVLGEVATPKTVLAPIGTKISALISYTGGTLISDYVVISGGPMMGNIVNENDVITKTTNAIIVLPTNHPVVLAKLRNPKILLKRAMSVCCQCRMCTELCPRNIASYPVEPHMVMRILSNGGKGDNKKIQGCYFCSGCGLCTMYSCPMGLSPKALIDQVKSVLRTTGADLSNITMKEPAKNEENKKVSLSRLTSRLALTKYEKNIPFDQKLLTAKTVRILLSQHIGAPAVAIVKKGDIVSKNSLIAVAQSDKLSVNIHASIDGKVINVDEKSVIISSDY